ncbi:SMP-30/gluconolactonase/LRE family protein [Mesorhizobium sp. CAU 1741]|uniref:SMP-30/gluconolactonase/LRE family protein n=1 Tax=Mesorhizobium sp. CAU 1741 TaxID=3140366 RepID=UPI00325B0F7F
MPVTIRCVSERADLLGESPVWDPDNGVIYWVDGVSRLLRCHDPREGTFRQWAMPSMIGSVALGDADTLVVGLQDGLYRFHFSDERLEPLFTPEPADQRIRFNDGKTDREGRFLCGSMGVHADPLGTLWRIDAAGRHDALVAGIRISNSLCFSPDGRTLYFADSVERAIRAYDYPADDGAPGACRTLVDTRAWNTGPDGATVDAAGYLWVALIFAAKIGRFAPDGTLDRLIDAPTDLPSSVAFGADDLGTLFVTSIKDSGSGRAISKDERGGCLFAIEGLGVRGLPERRFPLEAT